MGSLARQLWITNTVIFLLVKHNLLRIFRLLDFFHLFIRQIPGLLSHLVLSCHDVYLFVSFYFLFIIHLKSLIYASQVIHLLVEGGNSQEKGSICEKQKRLVCIIAKHQETITFSMFLVSFSIFVYVVSI